MPSLLDQKDTQHLKLDKLSVGQESMEMLCSLIGHLMFMIFLCKISIFMSMVIIKSKSIFSNVTPFSDDFDGDCLYASTRIIATKNESLELLVLRDNWLVATVGRLTSS